MSSFGLTSKGSDTASPILGSFSSSFIIEIISFFSLSFSTTGKVSSAWVTIFLSSFILFFTDSPFLNPVTSVTMCTTSPTEVSTFGTYLSLYRVLHVYFLQEVQLTFDPHRYYLDYLIDLPLLSLPTLLVHIHSF